MKVQDFIFFVAFAILFALRRPIYFVYAAVFSLLLAIPLFTFRIFFTAERLTWYAAAFICSYVVVSLRRPHTVQ
jgi:hypothetical protein